MNNSQKNPEKKSSFFCLPFFWVLCVNVFVIYISVPFYFLPHGERIRPMGWSMLTVMAMFAGFGGIILGMFRRYERVPHQWLIVTLALSPLPLAYMLFRFAILIRGLVPEP